MKTKMGTLRVKTMEELNEALKQLDWQVLSPGGAASMLGVSRAYIHQLEKNKRIRAYRLKTNFDKKGLSNIIQLLISSSKGADYIYIPIVDLEEYRKESKPKAKK